MHQGHCTNIPLYHMEIEISITFLHMIITVVTAIVLANYPSDSQ